METTKKTSKAKIFFTVVIILVLFKYFEGGMDKQVAKNMQKIENQVALDPRENIKNKEAIADIKTQFEYKVFEAIITEADVVYVSVADNGVDQSRFAQTLCNILKEHKATSKRVKIVKVNSQNDPHRDNAYGVLLGASFCN